MLKVDQPFATHTGGDRVFGPDGYRYVGMGDGGSGGDPQGHGQDRSDLLGSLLRLDVSAGGYTVPASNPFVGQNGVRPEIWNIGLRNPWRFSFDRATGDLYIGDVEQDMYEEVGVAAAASLGGENWRGRERRGCGWHGLSDSSEVAVDVRRLAGTAGQASGSGNLTSMLQRRSSPGRSSGAARQSRTASSSRSGAPMQGSSARL